MLGKYRKCFSVIKDRRGVSAVEFALVIPILLYLFSATIGYGLLFMTSISVHQLGADAARATIGGLSLEEKTALVKAHLLNNATDYILLEPENVVFSLNYDEKTQVTVLDVLYQPEHHPLEIFEGILPMPKDPFRVRQSISEHG